MDRNLIFDRTARLTGHEALGLMERLPVIIFGVGGVGGWTAEALARTGFADITLVDADCVAPTNINRQMPALSTTVGRPKAEVVAERLREINPDIHVTAIRGLYTPETSAEYDLTRWAYIFDCIDSLADKAHLILEATRAMALSAKNGAPVKFYSSMGAALKTDPTRISTAEFWKVKGCPLAAALRRRFKKSGQMPSRKFTCVYSDELVAQHPGYLPEGEVRDGSMTFNKAVTNGSLMHITAVFGLTLASLAVRDVMKRVEK